MKYFEREVFLFFSRCREEKLTQGVKDTGGKHSYVDVQRREWERKVVVELLAAVGENNRGIVTRPNF